MDILREPIALDSLSTPDQMFLHLSRQRPEDALRLVQYGWMRTPAQYGYGPMTRDHYLIHFIAAGKGRVVLPDQTYNLSAGQCFALYPHVISYYEADIDDPWEYYWLGFDSEYADRLLSRIGFRPDAIAMDLPNAAQVFALLDAMRNTPMQPENFLRLSGYMTLVFDAMPRSGAATLRRPDKHNQSLLDNEYVRIVISILETSYLEKLSVSEIALRLNLNRSYLSELFRRFTGKSIKRYLTELRVEQASLLLMKPSVSIRSAAFESGFSDPLYFSRIFTNIKGMSPSAYRKWLASQPPQQE